VQWEGDLGTVEQKRLWRGKERSRRGLDMCWGSIYSCGKDVMRLDKGIM
jgi:hypothetical protein